MHVITLKTLKNAANVHGSIAAQLDVWYRIAKSAKWRSIEDVRPAYPNADGVPVGSKVYTVFNIHGNSFRLIVGINYESATIFVKRVLTHAEYNKGDWKKK